MAMVDAYTGLRDNGPSLGGAVSTPVVEKPWYDAILHPTSLPGMPGASFSNAVTNLGANDPQPEQTFISPQTDLEGNANSVPDAIDSALEGGFSLSKYMAEHPGANYEDVMSYASLHSDEWAEKYLDYLTERGELDRANQYTAQREDTAYQRLVDDLKRAGLNPAMMYGSSASPSASGSQGYVKMSEGANSRTIGNYSKLKKLMLSYLAYSLAEKQFAANTVFKSFDMVTSLLASLFD